MSTSTKANAVTWFEIPAKDINKAKTFYESVLGTTLELHDMGPHKMAWFPMNEGAPGAMGSLIQGPSYTPSHTGTMVYFSVEDIPSTLKKVNEKGGKILQEKMSIGEHGFIAHFEDTEGNRVSLHSFK